MPSVKRSHEPVLDRSGTSSARPNRTSLCTARRVRRSLTRRAADPDTLLVSGGEPPPGPSGVLLLAEIDLSVGAVALIGGVIAFKYRCPLAPGAPGQR